jgi:carboxyl-terminal processing protease
MFTWKKIHPIIFFVSLAAWLTAISVIHAAPPRYYLQKKVYNDTLSIILNKYLYPVDNWTLLEGTIDGLHNLLGEKNMSRMTSSGRIEITIADQKTFMFVRDEIVHNALVLVDSVANLFDTIFEIFPEQQQIDVVHAAISGMVATLEPNSYFIYPEDLARLQEQNKGVFGGTGMEITIRDDSIYVVSPYDGTPAHKAGLLPNDQIVAVDGQPTQGMRIMEASEKIRGKKGSKVTLTVLREGWDSTREIILVRDVISHKTIKYFQLEPGFGYIRIINFLGSTNNDFITAIKRLNRKSSLEGLILDLRYNPGGLLNQSLNIADIFLNNEIIAKTDGRVKSDNKTYYARPSSRLPDYPIVIIINDGSASGTEIVSSALRIHQKAVLIGEKTYGKGYIQTTFPLQSSGALRLTTATLLTPAGDPIQDNGIVPDLNVSKSSLDYELPGHDQSKLPTLTLGATKGDPAVQLGLEILKQSLLLQDTPEEELAGLTLEKAAMVKRFNGMRKAVEKVSRKKSILLQ